MKWSIVILVVLVFSKYIYLASLTSYYTFYLISKFGLQGLSAAVRAECADIRPIHICTVMPYAVDTPHFQEGGNAIGRRAHG